MSLSKELTADVIAGSSIGFVVSPVIAAVDKALAENASGKAKLGESFLGTMKEVVTRPQVFFRSPAFAYIWLVYGSTYAAANACESVCAATNTNPAFPKWLSTFVTNTGTCIVKDRAFAKMYGTSAPAAVPTGSYLSWLARDVISMGVVFTLPPIVGKQVGSAFGSEKAGTIAAQFGLPLVMQFGTTPIHLLGYEIYNNPSGTTADRIAFLKKDYLKNVGLRCVRMIPPWSVGTTGNRELRAYLREKFT